MVLIDSSGDSKTVEWDEFYTAFRSTEYWELLDPDTFHIKHMTDAEWDKTIDLKAADDVRMTPAFILTLSRGWCPGHKPRQMKIQWRNWTS